MRSALALIWSVLFVAAAPLAADPAADAAAIRALQAAWNQAVEAGSIEDYLAVLDADVELLPTDAPPIRGRDHYGQFLGPVFEQDRFEIEVVDPGTVKVDGDLAYARYDYIIHRMPKGSDERISSLRKFLDVLRRQEDGSWRVLKHIWNYNEPDVTP
ncbi:MAG: SgcJ/EcaC family oxidoreductase [Gammaproteobacteria bacterium]|nr:SgcJ/EcaC family oxidoreductase [Gammaproteobacteria bacterium]